MLTDLSSVDCTSSLYRKIILYLLDHIKNLARTNADTRKQRWMKVFKYQEQSDSAQYRYQKHLRSKSTT